MIYGKIVITANEKEKKLCLRVVVINFPLIKIIRVGGQFAGSQSRTILAQHILYTYILFDIPITQVFLVGTS